MSLVHFIVSLLYTIAGISAFVAFLILQYYAAAVFGFVTAALSALTAHINWLHKQRRLNVWYEHSQVSQLFWLGFWAFALSFSGFVYHFVAYLVLQQYWTRIDLVVASIWGVIAVKSAAFLMFYADRYTREGIEMNMIVNEA